jgi:hypothetical protein
MIGETVTLFPVPAPLFQSYCSISATCVRKVCCCHQLIDDGLLLRQHKLNCYRSLTRACGSTSRRRTSGGIEVYWWSLAETRDVISFPHCTIIPSYCSIRLQPSGKVLKIVLRWCLMQFATAFIAQADATVVTLSVQLSASEQVAVWNRWWLLAKRWRYFHFPHHYPRLLNRHYVL